MAAAIKFKAKLTRAGGLSVKAFRGRVIPLWSMTMEQPGAPKVEREPVVAKWELWTVAQMLVSTRGDDAEAHAQAQLAEAQASGDEAGEIVWAGVITQLERIREGK